MLGSGLFEQLPHIAPAPDAAVGCGRASAAEAEQGLKSRHRLPASIVSENELVQIHLQLRAADTVIGADQPVLEIPDRAVRHRHDQAAPLRRTGRSGCFRAICLKPAACRPANPPSPPVYTVEPGATFCLRMAAIVVAV